MSVSFGDNTKLMKTSHRDPKIISMDLNNGHRGNKALSI